MGILKDLGHGAGIGAGLVVATPLYLVGKLVNSEFLQEAAEVACQATIGTGDLIGTVAEGAEKCVKGIYHQNGKEVCEGLGQAAEAGLNTVVGMGKGMVHIADQGLTTAVAIASGDTKTAMKAGKELAKVALVSAVAINAGDIIGGISDMGENLFDDGDAYELVENEGTHYVTPHWRTLPDGREIWVDGDGNTGINRSYGWTQSNPDFRVKA